MKEQHHVFLIPGFFGFTAFGDLTYFAHVRELLLRELARRGIEAEIVPVATSPTASVGERAGRLLEQMASVAGQARGPIHLIGHSTGALDARKVVSPGATLRTNVDPTPLVERVRSVVSISGPHRGTPLATFFAGPVGDRLLQLVSLSTIYALRYGRIPLGVITRLVGVLIRLDDMVSLRNTLLDQLYDQLLSDFCAVRKEVVEEFFREVGSDQSLVPELTPAGASAFNARTPDHPGVRYGAVLTAAREPGLGSAFAAGIDPYAHASHALYGALHRLSTWRASGRLPSVEVKGRILAGLGRHADWRTSDGVVPTLSQIWGEVIWAARADHLDAIGHFEERSRTPPHFDWLCSGTGFRRPDFEAVWRRVVEFIAA